MFKKSNKLSNLRCFSLGLLVALVMVMISGTALAQIDLDETIYIDMDMYSELFLTDVEAGEVLNVNIQVTNGGPIDVLLMSSTDYVDFLSNSEFSYYVDGSAYSIKSKSYSFTFPEGGDYYLVVDNTVDPMDGAYPTGAVDVRTRITTENPGLTQIEIQEIVDHSDSLMDDYDSKIELIKDLGARADALGSEVTKEIYLELKLKNDAATKSGEEFATYITENRGVLDETWVSDTLVLISENKVNMERDNDELDQFIADVENQVSTNNKNQGIVDNANRLKDDYDLKLGQVEEIQKRTDALGTEATKEMYIVWKLENKATIELGEKLTSYITENRDALDEKWVSDTLVLIATNKVNHERDNQELEQLINTPESPGFGAFFAIVGFLLAMAFRRR